MGNFLFFFQTGYLAYFFPYYSATLSIPSKQILCGFTGKGWIGFLKTGLLYDTKIFSW